MSKKIEVDTKTFIRFWLVILGFALLALFIWKSLSGLIIVGIAAFLAIAIQPLAKDIDKIDPKKSRPALASSIAYILVMLAIIITVSVIGPVVIGETTRFVGQAPTMFEQTIGGWEGINNFGHTFGIDNLREEIFSALTKFANSILTDIGGVVVNGVGTIANVATNVILVMVLTLLFLLEGPKLMQGFWQLYRSKDSHRNKTVALIQHTAYRMKEVIATYVSKQLTVALLDGLVVAITIFALSIIFGFSGTLAIPMGLLAVICYMIPMFGPIISCILVSVIVLCNSPFAAIIFALIYIIYAQIENNAIAPKIQGNALKLSPLVVLIAITLGIHTFGLIGALIAIPIAGCIKVWIEEYPKFKELQEN